MNAQLTPGIAAQKFRAELVKMLPGYVWVIHKSRVEGYLEATGSQSSGFNRLSTVSVVRTDRDGKVSYEVKSAGYGLRAKWLHQYTDGTLARALRGLQKHYEYQAATYRGHAQDLEHGRRVEVSEGQS